MKTVDLSKKQRSLGEVLALAKSEAVLIHSPFGEDFILEHADEFDREVAALGGSAKFRSFLEDRAKEAPTIGIDEIRKKRGV
ncbi:MAG: hypothetical protein NTW86_20710 [Candidatus Sumerlaeota bacterium]|nr:hypothetical protein [Candidatus Sumerlaeota bacterium]